MQASTQSPADAEVYSESIALQHIMSLLVGQWVSQYSAITLVRLVAALIPFSPFSISQYNVVDHWAESVTAGLPPSIHPVL